MLKKMAVAALFAVCVSGLTLAVDMSEIPNSLDKIKEGQWVKYKMPMGGEQKQTVAKVAGKGDDMEITFKVELKMMGQEIPAQEQVVKVKTIREQLATGLKNANEVKVSKTKVTAGGKEYDVTLIESVENGQVTRAYMTDTVPITATVKVEIEGLSEEPVLELVEFGE